MSVVRKQRLITAALIVSVTLGTLFLLQLQSGFQQLRSLTTVSLPTPEDISLSSAVLSDYILNFMLRYTEAAVPVSMFLGGLGVPLPNSLLVIILGSLVQQRLLLLASLSWLIILPTILGDICSYLLIRAALQSQRLQRVL